MGLDWNPANKAKPGHEKEFEGIVLKLSKNSWWGRKKTLKRFTEISIPAFETLGAPQVGKDPDANEWARRKYSETTQELSEEEFISKLSGFYVLELLPPCDGIPAYSNGGLGYVEIYSFRAQLLEYCEEIIGGDLLEKAYGYHSPEELVRYGNALIQSAKEYSAERGIEIPDSSPGDDESPSFFLHVVTSAGRWCKFWGERGHMLEPYF